LCELIAVYLGAVVPRGFVYRRPGADHHARFMSKAIYLMKIALLSHCFPMYGTEEADVNRMALYIGLFYGNYFLRSPLAAMAPANDLQFFTWMNQFKAIDKKAADATLSSIERHLDYLTEELVILALFDPETSDEEKKKMADKLLSIPRPSEFPAGKPKTPTISYTETTLIDPISLSSFIGPRF
jgi:hypothetical protein